jgi:hypothetical protein
MLLAEDAAGGVAREGNDLLPRGPLFTAPPASPRRHSFRGGVGDPYRGVTY